MVSTKGKILAEWFFFLPLLKKFFFDGWPCVCVPPVMQVSLKYSAASTSAGELFSQG